MGFGLSQENGNSKLVLSTDGILLGYLGKATYISTTQTNGETNGYSTYTFSHAGSIVPVLKLVTGLNTVTLSMSQAGSTWTITVYHGGTPVDAQGFQTQYQADVYVWGVPLSVSGFGMALYSSSGVLVGDISKRPLFVRQRINWNNTTVSETIAGGIVTPAVLGSPVDWQRIRTGSGPWTFHFDSGAWGRSATEIRRDWVQREYQPNEDTGNPTSTQRRAARGIIVDVNGLS